MGKPRNAEHEYSSEPEPGCKGLVERERACRRHARAERRTQRERRGPHGGASQAFPQAVHAQAPDKKRQRERRDDHRRRTRPECQRREYGMLKGPQPWVRWNRYRQAREPGNEQAPEYRHGRGRGRDDSCQQQRGRCIRDGSRHEYRLPQRVDRHWREIAHGRSIARHWLCRCRHGRAHACEMA